MDKNTLDKFGDKIYELRKQKNVSQDELAKKVGVSRQTVSKWEANVIQPKADKLQRICSSLNIELNYFAINEQDNEESRDFTIDSNEDILVCDIVAQSNETVECSEQTVNLDKKNGLQQKTNKFIIVISIAFLVIFIIGIVIILIPLIFKAPKIDGSSGEVYTSTTWNFSIVNVGWIASIVSFIILFIMLIFTIYRKVKNKTKKG